MQHAFHFNSAAWLQACLTLLAMLMLGACALSPPQTGTSAASVRPSTPLPYYAWVQQAPKHEMDAERTRLSQSTAAVNPVVKAIQLSMVLISPAMVSDETELQAVTLLEQALEAPLTAAINPDYRIFAGILLAHLEQKQALRIAGADHASQLETIRALESNTRHLQDQIKALTSIEQQIIEREQRQKLEQEPAIELDPEPLQQEQE